MKTYHQNILMSRIIIIIFISPCKHGLDGRRWLIRVNWCRLPMGNWCWCTKTSAVPLPSNIPPLPPLNFCRPTPNQPLTLLLSKCPNDLNLPCHFEYPEDSTNPHWACYPSTKLHTSIPPSYTLSCIDYADFHNMPIHKNTRISSQSIRAADGPVDP